RHEGLARPDEAGYRPPTPGSLLEVGEGQRGLPRAPRRIRNRGRSGSAGRPEGSGVEGRSGFAGRPERWGYGGPVIEGTPAWPECPKAGGHGGPVRGPPLIPSNDWYTRAFSSFR